MDEYDSFYQTSILPELRRLEKQRRRTVQNIIMLGALAIAGGLAAIFHGPLSAVTGWDESHLFVAAAASGFAAAALIFHLRSRMRREIKWALVAPTCRFLGLDYSLDGKGFPLEHFKKARILPHHDVATLQDRIRGKQDDIDFELCEASLKRRVERTDGKGQTRSELRTLFQGLLLIYSFPKAFRGRTLVVPDRTWLGNRLAGLGLGERVRLEDLHFEKLYEVFSNDQVEARYLLTPVFMERLTALADRLGTRRGLSFAFADRDLLIAFNSGATHFEGGSLFRPLERPERAKALMQELTLIHDLIDHLDLTNRTGI